MAGREIVLAADSYLMIHDPLITADGKADELRTMADLLDKSRETITGIYARRTRQTREKIAEMMQAETWLDSTEAVALGFADRVSSPMKMAAAFDVSQFKNVPSTIGVSDMTATPATLEEIRNACPGASDEFLIRMLGDKAALPTCQSVWMAELTARVSAAEDKGTRPGNEPLATASRRAASHTGDAVSEFDTAVRERMANGMERRAAVLAVCRQNPQLHQEFVASTNPNRPAVQSLIAERFAL
jgi:hypothetical protein